MCMGGCRLSKAACGSWNASALGILDTANRHHSCRRLQATHLLLVVREAMEINDIFPRSWETMRASGVCRQPATGRDIGDSVHSASNPRDVGSRVQKVLGECCPVSAARRPRSSRRAQTRIHRSATWCSSVLAKRGVAGITGDGSSLLFPRRGSSETTRPATKSAAHP